MKNELLQELLLMEIFKTQVIAPFYKRYKTTLAALHNEIGEDNPQQVNGVVMRLVSKKGQWVDFTPYELQRTRVVEGLLDKNTLTVKDAVAQGFKVEVPSFREDDVLKVVFDLLEEEKRGASKDVQ